MKANPAKEGRNCSLTFCRGYNNNNNDDNLFSIYEFLHKKYTQQQLFIIYIIAT